ncbi:ATP phosphoribosyltransferase regulatory subunit [Thiobacter aerophilum]|uniref:ATP phosphoribosyltransferase regulatory subunit n=1 Tax=Thiobacter aerophilum TaxID=3121275 RepID=A0ABV0EFV5_9BURK
MHSWLLPENIEDILPPQAWRLEQARRTALDLFASHGYQLIQPPLIQFLESLLTGTGRDMRLITFSLVDQLSGRPLGVRADITPQAARIDAHLLNRQGATRLCYAGSVLHTRPASADESREPFQVGAELFGHAGLEADLEIQRLMLELLARLGLSGVLLALGHVGIFRALARRAQLDEEREADLFQALQMKDVPTLRELTVGLPQEIRTALEVLPNLYGPRAILEEAVRRLPPYPEIGAALDALQTLADALQEQGTELHFDLAELRGYHYHSGVVFAAYVRQCPRAVAQGGRYDGAGKVFGRARSATGFSMDLRGLLPLLPATQPRGAILAPWGGDTALKARIEELRAAGEVVVVELPGQEAFRAESGCDRQLVPGEGGWQVVALRREA